VGSVYGEWLAELAAPGPCTVNRSPPLGRGFCGRRTVRAPSAKSRGRGSVRVVYELECLGWGKNRAAEGGGGRCTGDLVDAALGLPA
jgi:hypothetical protein